MGGDSGYRHSGGGDEAAGASRHRRRPTVIGGEVADRSDAEPLVSIVTPFHNTAPYLEECIRSVLAQTYTNYEYLLVDNASTDDGGEIAARYAEKDARIRVVE